MVASQPGRGDDHPDDMACLEHWSGMCLLGYELLNHCAEFEPKNTALKNSPAGPVTSSACVNSPARGHKETRPGPKRRSLRNGGELRDREAEQKHGKSIRRFLRSGKPAAGCHAENPPPQPVACPKLKNSRCG